MFHFHNSHFFENTPAPKHLHGGHNPYETTNGKLMLKDKVQGKIGRRFGNDLTNQYSIKPQTLFVDCDFKKTNHNINHENNTIHNFNNEKIEVSNNQKQDFLNDKCLKIEEETTQLNENDSDEVEYCPNSTSWVPNMDDVINEIDLDYAFQTIGSYRSFVSSRNIQDINLDITHDNSEDEHFDLIPIKNDNIPCYSPKNSMLENIIQNHCQLPRNCNDEFEHFPLLLHFDADIIDDENDVDNDDSDNDDDEDEDEDVDNNDNDNDINDVE